MAAKPRKRTVQPSKLTNDLLSSKVAKKLAANNLMRAQLNLIDNKLNDPAFLERVKYTEKHPGNYIQALMNKRTEILRKLRGGRSYPKPYVWFHKGFGQGEGFNPWNILPLPTLAEGIDLTPNIPGTEGEIATLWLDPGYVAFSADLYDNTVDPTEKFWLHNWSTVVQLPPAEEKGVIVYRFTVECNTVIYFASAQSGTIMAWVGLATASDTTIPIPWGNGFEAWPVNDTLPMKPKAASAAVPIYGEIAVDKGQAPVIGLIYGVIVGLTSGEVDLLPTSNFSARLTVPYSATPSDYGRIEWRFYSQLWLDLLKNSQA